ncbi:MAG: LacI family DNA-binding transcriptional regulator [Pirellulales bacterium]|nr:LacI family DNA-binding transcriptional regulator [Pirellulales bacterium]
MGHQANIVLQLLDKQVGGVAIVPTTEPLTPAFQIRQLQDQGVPVVFCHRCVEGVSAPFLSLGFREIGRLAGQALIERGHRRVAFFTQQHLRLVHDYEMGLKEGLQVGDGDSLVESVCVGGGIVLKEETVWECLQKVFGEPDPPTAIFASFDSLAEMIYLLLPRLGLRVPDDVSLVGEGGAWREGAISRRLTSVVLDEVATGRRAVSLLHEMRSGDRPVDNGEEFALNLSLYEGETLAVAATNKHQGS